MPIQQMMLGSGGGGAGEYIDNMFGITLYTGNEGSKTVTTNIDLVTDGGMLWGKSRDGSHAPFLYDTVRGVTKYLRSDVAAGQVTLATSLTAFSTSGFSLGSHVGLNDDVPNTAWSFKQIPGFFDMVHYEGNAAWPERNIAHQLDAIPGCIIVKNLDSSANWTVYHRGIDFWNPQYYSLELNEQNARAQHASKWNNTAPTSTQFTVGNDSGQIPNNANGDDYVAYIFAGGDSTSDSAVGFDGTGDYLSIASSSDFTFGTGDFTLECWINPLSCSQDVGIPDPRAASTNAVQCMFGFNSSLQLFVYVNGSHLISPSSDTAMTQNQWQHVAYCRSSGTGKIYHNGKEVASVTDNNNYIQSSMAYGWHAYQGATFSGKISNVRVTKGQALYTTHFSVPLDPFTQESQNADSDKVKLLCCNGSTTTASTVTPGTITANGDVSVTTNNSIFTDTSGDIFGKGGDEGVVKCGNFIGNGSSTGPEIWLGFEPQWLMIKNATAGSRDWKVLDCMRGISTGYNDASLIMNDYSTEADESVIDLTSTGFKITSSNAHYNENGETIIFVAIRRPDGTVGKPPTAGTEVFTPVKGSSGAPLFVTPHTVDFHFAKDWDVVKDWNVSSRLTQTRRLETNTDIIEDSNSYQVGDYQTGWGSYGSGDGSRMGYNFKRHAGFDVVTYKGSEIVPHNLGVRPEMVWIKQRDGSTRGWAVGCPDILGINNNTLALNEDYASGTSNVNVFADSAAAQSKTRVVLHGNENGVSSLSANYLMLLFASVSGISKIGTYAGSSGSVTVTCGFQPRFILLKVTNTTEDWIVFDTVMGIASGNDTRLRLNRDGAAVSTSDWVDLDSDGFTVNNTGSSGTNADGNTYLFYAHA